MVRKKSNAGSSVLRPKINTHTTENPGPDRNDRATTTMTTSKKMNITKKRYDGSEPLKPSLPKEKPSRDLTQKRQVGRAEVDRG